MPTFSSDIYVQEIDVKPNDVFACVLIWNSAATISNPSSRVYKNRVDVSASIMSGSNASSSNVQTSKIITIPENYSGSDVVLEWRADIEGKTLNKWLLMRVAQLPR